MSKSRHGPLRVGVGGPVGSGKTALMDALCKSLRQRFAIAAITMNAPRSGSSSSSAPTTATAIAIGTKPLRNSCIQSCLRTA